MYYKKNEYSTNGHFCGENFLKKGKKMTGKNTKLKRIFDMAFDGETKSDISVKLGITPNAFYKNKSYNDAHSNGLLQRTIQDKDAYQKAYRDIGTKHGLSAKDSLDVFPRVLDAFVLSQKDFKDVLSMAKAINRVSISESTGEITAIRAKNLTDRLTSAISAAGRAIEFTEFQDWKAGLSYGVRK